MSHVIDDLVSYLDQELPNSEMSRVRQHLDQCAECSAELESIRSVYQEMSVLIPLAMRDVDPPKASWRQVKHVLHCINVIREPKEWEMTGSQSGRSSRLIVGLALAITTIIAVVFVGKLLLDRYAREAAGPTAVPAYEPTASLQPSAMPEASPAATRPAAPDLAIYADALGEGWEDWSWNDDTIAIDYSNGDPVHSGSSSTAVTFTGGWSGLQIGYHGDNLDASDYDTLRFWIHGGTTGGQPIVLQVGDNVKQEVRPQAGTWTQIDVSLQPLGSPRTIYSISWFNNSDASQGTFYVDDITLVDTGAPAPTIPPPGPGPALSIDAGSGVHSISPYIYGMNFADEDLAADLNLPVRRWGGNSTTRYNWQLDVHNTGSDWYFENIPGDPNNTETDQFVKQNQRTGTKTLLTIPLIGWTPKRSQPHPFDCGFPVSTFGQQQSTDEWDPNCGNGNTPDGTPISSGDPSLTSTPITTAFVTDWLKHLEQQFGTADSGGVMFYDLDNEPMLWNSTHRDVHPNPTSYDELRDSTYAYGAALKSADPSALTLGPALWGWCAYFYSAVDDCGGNTTDLASHGNLQFVPWYLQQMRDYEQQHGTRILDYLDLHFYPQANGVSQSNPGDEAAKTLRLRSTRALWDPAYADESWIADVQDGPYVRLIPRMREWVEQNYPGTKLAITEYNWGALGDINGALAEADVLGIFGREGLDLATLWGPPKSDQPGAYAFRMYRNYDGQAHTFGETGVQAASSDQDKLAIYAALRNEDGALTLMIINKTNQTLASHISLAGFTPGDGAQVYRYSSANVAAIVHEADAPVSADGFDGAFPPESITLIVIPVGDR